MPVLRSGVTADADPGTFNIINFIFENKIMITPFAKPDGRLADIANLIAENLTIPGIFKCQGRLAARGRYRKS